MMDLKSCRELWTDTTRAVRSLLKYPVLRPSLVNYSFSSGVDQKEKKNKNFKNEEDFPWKLIMCSWLVWRLDPPHRAGFNFDLHLYVASCSVNHCVSLFCFVFFFSIRDGNDLGKKSSSLRLDGFGLHTSRYCTHAWNGAIIGHTYSIWRDVG